MTILALTFTFTIGACTGFMIASMFRDDQQERENDDWWNDV